MKKYRMVEVKIDPKIPVIRTVCVLIFLQPTSVFVSLKHNTYQTDKSHYNNKEIGGQMAKAQ